MNSPNWPRVTFGVIVFNGEPFTRYCLRSLYPFAHEIIVVEGAVQGAAKLATEGGHSTDGTLNALLDYKAKEDPEDKIHVVTRDGCWKEKDEQSVAFAERATGDYLWQVDIDEFYRAGDMAAVLKMLKDDPEISSVSFNQIAFFGGFDYAVDGWYLKTGADVFHRLFKWGKGFRYTSHRPPTVRDQTGRDLRGIKWINGEETARRGIHLYHYSLLFPKQVKDKARYYAGGPWGNYSAGILQWADENYFKTIRRPFQVHNVHTQPSWIDRFQGMHPEQIQRLEKDIEAGRLAVECRSTADIEDLLGRKGYRLGRWLLKALFPLSKVRGFPRYRLSRLVSRIAINRQTGKFCLN